MEGPPDAERVIQESGIHVAHVRGDRAFYNLQTDKVTLPEREQFASANGYYQTALHELGHATGPPRPDGPRHPEGRRRQLRQRGVRPRRTPRGNVRNDDRRAGRRRPRRQPRRGVRRGVAQGAGPRPKEIYKAAADAQKISDYLLRPIREREQETEQEHAALAEKYSAARSPQISHAPTPQAEPPERESGISR